MHIDRQNSVKRKPSTRRGYALMLVLIFVVLFLALLGVAWRGVASALRIEAVHTIQTQRDEGSVQALAQAIHLLETGLPPASPYVCGVTINTSSGPRSYTVTFTLEEGANWSVRSAVRQPNENLPAMPDTFATVPR